MKIPIILVSILLLTGCALGAQTKQELYNNYGYLEKRCSQLEHLQIYNLIFNNMNKCIAGTNSTMIMAGAVPVIASSDVTIQGELNESEGSTISAYVAGGPGHYFYSTIVKIKKDESCPSVITIYGMSSFNKKALHLIDHWLTNNNNCVE